MIQPAFHDWSTSSTEDDALAAMVAVADSLDCFGLRELMDGPGSALTTTQQRWCKSLLRTGVEALIAMPVQVPPCEYWNLSLLSATTREGGDSLTGDELAGLMYFAHGLVQFCTRQLHWRESGRQDRQVNLRPRERDCLYWAVLGKSAAETAEILDLKTETVRKYLKTALARLNARTKAQAVAKALQWGLLELAAP